MKTFDGHGPLPLPIINECPRGKFKKCRARSKGKPDVPARSSINVRFAIPLPVEIEIKPFVRSTPAGLPALTQPPAQIAGESLCKKQ
jgi:hypothetical protein